MPPTPTPPPQPCWVGEGTEAARGTRRFGAKAWHTRLMGKGRVPPANGALWAALRFYASFADTSSAAAGAKRPPESSALETGCETRLRGPSPQWARADSGSRSPRRRGSARVRETRPNAGLGLSARAGVHFPQWKHLENAKSGEKESGDARPRPGARRAPSPHPGAPRGPWLRGGRGPVGVAWGGGAERRAHFWAPTAVASAPRSGRGEGPQRSPRHPGAAWRCRG